MVIPRYLKIHLPATAKASSTPAATQQASRAMRMRCAGVSVGVIARNAGIVANGSMMTNRELAASRMYSGRDTGKGYRGLNKLPELHGQLALDGTRREDRVG